MTDRDNSDRAVTHGASHIHIEKKKTSWLPWLLLGLGLLALLFWLFNRNRDEMVATTTSTTITATTAATNSGAPVAADAGTVAATNGATVGQLGPYLAGAEATPRTFTFDNLNFDTSASAIRPADRGTIDEVAGLLGQYPASRIRIVGYADARGSDPANTQLGTARAEAVKAALVDKGVAADRVETDSGGEGDPLDTNASAAGQAQNRRTELVVLSR